MRLLTLSHTLFLTLSIVFLSAFNLLKVESNSQARYLTKTKSNKGFFENFFNLFD